MTKIGKRIIIIAIPVAVSAVLLLSSVFSAAKFNTFNCFSSFPAFFWDHKRLGECDRDRRRKNYNVSACGFC